MRASLTRSVADPVRGSVLGAIALIASGFVTIAFGWRGTATTLDVAEQVTYFLSAGTAAIGLVATGLVVLLVQRARHAAAIERDIVTRLVSAVAITESDHEGQRS